MHWLSSDIIDLFLEVYAEKIEALNSLSSSAYDLAGGNDQMMGKFLENLGGEEEDDDDGDDDTDLGVGGDGAKGQILLGKGY